MKYNSILFDSSRLRLQFINGLGKDFTQLRNMPTLPHGCQTTDITLLTHTARTYLSTLEANYEINRYQSLYLKAVSAELPPKNPPGRPRQHPCQQTPVSSNPPHPTPTQPSLISPLHVPGTPRMVNSRVGTRTDNQRAIMKEIRCHQHNPECIEFWQSKAGSAKCYYHLTDHTISTFYKLCTVMHRVATGSPPPDPVERPQCPPLQGNLGVGAAPMVRYTSDSQVGD